MHMKRPTKRKKQQPRLVGGYSAIHELMASPTEPMPAGTFDQRIADTMASLERIGAGTARLLDWAACCSAANTVETLLARRELDDPDGLLRDAFAALKDAAGRLQTATDPVQLDGNALEDVRDMLDGWADLLRTKPARTIVRAERETDRRARDLAAGRIGIGDLLVVA